MNIHIHLRDQTGGQRLSMEQSTLGGGGCCAQGNSV